MIYLDNIHAQRPLRSAIQAMIPYLEESYGVPLQPHRMGQELFPAMEQAYRTIYDFFHAKESDLFVFTSSGQEAVSQVMHSVFHEVYKKTGKNHFVVSQIAEAAAVLSASRFEEEGCVLQMCPLSSQGYIVREGLLESITPRTALVSVPSACALTGVVQPLSDIAALCQERGILLHVDVTHSIGKQLLDLDILQANFITFNGDQIGAPRGTGGLFVRGASIIPLICGEDEGVRFRGGALHIGLLMGLSQALSEMKEKEMLYCLEVARLRDAFEALIMQKIPEAVVLYADQERLPHISCIAFPKVRNELLLFALNRKQLFASMGGGTFQQIELVLQASKLDRFLAQAAITCSLSQETTESEITRAVQIIEEAYNRLKRLAKAL